MESELYTDLGQGNKLLWSVDFGDAESAGKDMARTVELLREIDEARAASAGGIAPRVLTANALRGGTPPDKGRLLNGVGVAMLGTFLEAKAQKKCAILIEDAAGDLWALGDAADGKVNEVVARNGGEIAEGLADEGVSGQLLGPTWAKAWHESTQVKAVEELSTRRATARAEYKEQARGEERHADTAGNKDRPGDDWSSNMDKIETTEAQRKSYPLTVRRNFILSDKATGAPVITERVGKTSGKAYQTCQVTIPGGTKTVQNGQVVDLSGYQATMFVNKNVTDPEKLDVTFYLDAARDITLFKTDRETGERSYVTVTAGELSHAVAQERKEWQQAHQRPQQDKGKATGEATKDHSAKAAAKPRREFKMTPESAAQPATEAQMRKLTTLMEAGAVTQAEIDAVSNKGEASQLISLALEKPVNAPEGFVASEAPTLESTGKHFSAPSQDATARD